MNAFGKQKKKKKSLQVSRLTTALFYLHLWNMVRIPRFLFEMALKLPTKTKSFTCHPNQTGKENSRISSKKKWETAIAMKFKWDGRLNFWNWYNKRPRGKDISRSNRKWYILSPTHKFIIGKKDWKLFLPPLTFWVGVVGQTSSSSHYRYWSL